MFRLFIQQWWISGYCLSYIYVWIFVILLSTIFVYEQLLVKIKSYYLDLLTIFYTTFYWVPYCITFYKRMEVCCPSWCLVVTDDQQFTMLYCNRSKHHFHSILYTKSHLVSYVYFSESLLTVEIGNLILKNDIFYQIQHSVVSYQSLYGVIIPKRYNHPLNYCTFFLTRRTILTNT